MLFVTLALATGCATRPHIENTVVGQEGSAKGQWRGKALVRDLRAKKSATLDLEILAQEPSRLRMEVTGSFGVHVASVALNGDTVFLSLTRERRFVQAPASSDALSRLVPVRISPKALLQILFDRVLDRAEWKCQTGPDRLPVQCVGTASAVTVKWQERKGESRRLQIGSAEASVDMVLDEAKSKVEFNESAFMLNAPQGYRVDTLSQP